MREPTDLKPIVGKINIVARLLGCSVSTVRRRVATDPTFPKPFRDGPNADWEWLLAEIEDHAHAKAAKCRLGSPVAAPTNASTPLQSQTPDSAADRIGGRSSDQPQTGLAAAGGSRGAAVRASVSGSPAA